MADRKISDLTALTTPAAGDFLPIVDISEASASNKNKRITIEELLRGAPDGTAAAPSIAFESDGGNGLYLAGTDTIGVSTNGVNRLTLDTAACSSTLPVVHPLGAAATPSITFTGDLNTGLWSPTADTLAASTGGSERARIDSSGRLLVGTSSSTNNIRVQESLALVATGSGNIGGMAITNYGGTGASSRPLLDFQRSRGTTDGSLTVVASGDQLGSIIFRGADGSQFVDAAFINCEVDGTPGANDMPGRLVFSTTAGSASSPTERMRLRNNGELWIHSSGGDPQFLITHSTGAGTSLRLISGRYSGGTVGTGTESFRVYTNGDVQNTNNSYGAISDIKLKENIVDANSQWDDLKALQVRNYNFKEGQTHTQIGLVAQEVELVSPGLVTESPDRDVEGNDLGTVTKSVNYSVLYMKAVKALQEAMERIEVLEARLDAANL